MNERDDPKVDDIIDNPDAAVNKPEWTDNAVRQSIETTGPNAGNLTYSAADRHARLIHDHDMPEHAEHYEFRETVNCAVNMEPVYFASPEITEEEAIRRLKWARERAKAAVDQAKLIQSTADSIRGTDPDFKPPESASEAIEPDVKPSSEDRLAQTALEDAEVVQAGSSPEGKAEAEPNKVDAEYLNNLGIWDGAQDLFVFVGNDQWQPGWDAFIDVEHRSVIMTYKAVGGDIKKAFTFEEAEANIRTSGLVKIDSIDDDSFKKLIPEKPRSKEEAAALFESRVKESGTIDELIKVVKSSTGFPLTSRDMLYVNLDLLQDETVSQDLKDHYLGEISVEYGIRDAVIRIMNQPQKPQSPEPENPTLSSPEVRHNFRNIPMRDGRIAYGEVIFESPNMITIMTPQGKMDIYRSSLLHPSGVYTMGDAEDLTVLDAHHREEQKKRDEEQEEIQRRRRNQTPPRHMGA